jgi:AcrR family transcriptional regulator
MKRKPVVDTKRARRQPQPNHRTLVGQQRRARTEVRILQAALQVFAASRGNAPVIDDFIKAAGIARGTFYNYFRSTDELFDATATWLLEEPIDDAMEGITDPVIRLGTGIRLLLRNAEQDRPWAAFMSKYWKVDAFGGLQLQRALNHGLRLKRLRGESVDAAWDLTIGTLRQALERIASNPQLSGYADSVAAAILQGLGADRALIEKIISRSLPELRRPIKTIA